MVVFTLRAGPHHQNALTRDISTEPVAVDGPYAGHKRERKLLHCLWRWKRSINGPWPSPHQYLELTLPRTQCVVRRGTVSIFGVTCRPDGTSGLSRARLDEWLLEMHPFSSTSYSDCVCTEPKPRTRPSVKVSVGSKMAECAEALPGLDNDAGGEPAYINPSPQEEHAARLVIPGMTAESPTASGAS